MNLIFAALFMFSSQAVLTVEKVTCESLRDQANEYCEAAMCEDFTLVGEPCIHDGDFLEGFQICVTDTLNDVLAQYNLKNPNAKLACEQD